MSRRHDLKIEEIRKLADDANERLDYQAQRVEALTGWLRERSNQNGFGADFEFSLTPKAAR